MVQKKGTIEEISFMSKALGEELTLMLYKPANFTPLYKYHLVIAQDGQDYFNLGRIARVTEELLEDGAIPNILIIGIPYMDVNDRYSKYHPNGQNHESYIRFLAHELVPYLDEKYPTYQMGRGRVLVGDSLGGTVSLLAGLKYPNTFGKIVLQSPFVNSFVKKQIQHFPSPHLLQLYHSVGTKETAVETTKGETKDFVNPNRELATLMKSKKFDSSFHEFDGDHTWTYWQPDLKQALQIILKD
ncbi:alpha/beta hydrolase [Bacillus salitolerans]|uniref:Alpha/beta hydrolase n=1 Tax=Bacillus salitolerans TaxID=1437434 RepID=A0ABW4LK99_9BACI